MRSCAPLSSSHITPPLSSAPPNEDRVLQHPPGHRQRVPANRVPHDAVHWETYTEARSAQNSGGVAALIQAISALSATDDQTEASLVEHRVAACASFKEGASIWGELNRQCPPTVSVDPATKESGVGGGTRCKGEPKSENDREPGEQGHARESSRSYGRTT